MTASGVPTPTLSESSSDTLPAGVTFTAATGVLSGTPAAGTGGTYTLNFTATNGVGSAATQSFTLTVNQATQAPAITSASSTTFTVGAAGTFTVTTTGSPTPSLTEKRGLAQRGDVHGQRRRYRPPSPALQRQAAPTI